MANSQRWQVAQEAEQEFWALHLGSGSTFLSAMREFAQAATKLEEMRSTVRTGVPAGSLVEFGIGPWGVGVIHFLGSAGRAELIGCDPLNLDTTELESSAPPVVGALKGARSLPYKHLVTKAEATGLPSASAAVVVLHNMLDHVDDPVAVLREAGRLLAPDGVCFLVCDYFSVLGRWKATFLDPRRHPASVYVRAHPHRFDADHLRRTVQLAGLAVAGSSITKGGWRHWLGGETAGSLLLVASESAGADDRSLFARRVSQRGLTSRKKRALDPARANLCLASNEAPTARTGGSTRTKSRLPWQGLRID